MKTSLFDGEEKLPKLGGFTYCNWKLTTNFLQDINELIIQSRCWRHILDQINKIATVPLDQINKDATVPKFKIQTVFAKYVESFIKIYKIFFDNPYGLDKAVDKDEVSFKILPNTEILNLFMQVEYLQLISESKDAEDKIVKNTSTKFICRYDFTKFFQSDFMNDNEYLCK